MIQNKRLKTCRELWRDFPELTWKPCQGYDDADGYVDGNLLCVYFQGRYLRWVVCGSGVAGSLKTAQEVYIKTLRRQP